MLKIFLKSLFVMLLLVPTFSWGGVDFDNTDDSIDFGDVNDISGAITIAAWVNGTYGETGFHQILSKYNEDDASTDASYYLSIIPSKNLVLVVVANLAPINISIAEFSIAVKLLFAITFVSSLPSIYVFIESTPVPLQVITK